MKLWEAIVLGLIQGLTEFLPVSSSGHLALAQYFFGLKEPQLFFDIMLHVGTLGAVLVAFRRDIRDVSVAILGREPKARHDSSPRMTKKSGRVFAFLIILGTIPTVIIALALSTFVEKLFVTPIFVSAMLIITGGILWLSSRLKPAEASPRGLNIVNALIIGVAQGLAVLPGISRSGTTISAALMRRVNKEEAARFSLLLSVPAIIGALILELKDLTDTNISIWTIIAGTLVAFVVGYVAIKFLLGTLRKGMFSRFSYYCWGIAVVSIILYIAK